MMLINKDFSKYKLYEFPCLDHEPHKFRAMFEFNIDALIFLSSSSNSKSIIAIHCKAGKGRTGLMICWLLVFLGFKFINSNKILHPDEEEKLNNIEMDEEINIIKNLEQIIKSKDWDEAAIKIYFDSLEPLLKYCDSIVKYFGDKRTYDSKGITIQSQIRFIRMYTLYLFNRFKLQTICDGGCPDPQFSFYKDVLNELSKKSLDDIKPSKSLPMLVPLK